MKLEHEEIVFQDGPKNLNEDKKFLKFWRKLKKMHFNNMATCNLSWLFITCPKRSSS